MIQIRRQRYPGRLSIHLVRYATNQSQTTSIKWRAALSANQSVHGETIVRVKATNQNGSITLGSWKAIILYGTCRVNTTSIPVLRVTEQHVAPKN